MVDSEFLNRKNFFIKSEAIIGVDSTFFLHEMLFKKFMAGNFKGCVAKIFAEKVARGNSVQIRPDFPAKSLSIYTKFFSYLINLSLKRIETNKMWNETRDVYWVFIARR